MTFVAELSEDLDVDDQVWFSLTKTQSSYPMLHSVGYSNNASN